MNATSNRSLVLGQQTFDGLGRQLTVAVGGRTTHYEYTAAQIPPSANVLADGNRVEFIYEPHLNNQILEIRPANEPVNRFAYHPQLNLPISATGPLGSQIMAYTRSGLPDTDTWTMNGERHVTTWRHGLGGLLLGFDDADGVKHERRYDRFGRLDLVSVDGVRRDISYDALDRLASLSDIDTASRNSVVQTLTYDGFGREHTRTFDITAAGGARRIVQTYGYSALDQLVLRQWQEGSEIGKETFAYDTRGRLIQYTANETAAPSDPFGNRIIEQIFTLNALDGYVQTVSTFASGDSDTATFEYASSADPTQVSGIRHSHPSWPARIDLGYDACGRVLTYAFPATANRPGLDRTLTWDAQDRLIKVDDRTQTCEYRYDPNGQLADRVINGLLTRSFFSGGRPTHEKTGDTTLRLIGDGGALFALTRLAAGVRQATTLLGTDAQGSVRIEADSTVRTRLYTAHGAEPANDANGPFGYAGERRETLTGWYIPSGYRPYDPVIMGFLSPDNDSPFGQGGLNAYAYCAGDPVNRIDPSGHGWLTWALAGIGIGLGIVATVATLGAAAPALAALTAGGIGALTTSGAVAIGVAAMSAVSLGTGIASTVLEATGKDSKAASILGWISMGTGLAETGLAMAPKAAAKLAARTGRSVGRAATKTAKGAGGAPIRSPRLKTQGTETGAQILRRGQDDIPEVIVHKKLWGESLAFESHGSPGGRLMNQEGSMVSADDFFEEIVSSRLTSMRPKNEPVVLLACSAGKTGSAQRIADLSGSPVMAWQDDVFIPTYDIMSRPLTLDPGNYRAFNYPMRAFRQGDKPYFTGEMAREQVPAEFTIYWPA